jgi:hypothetical protein
MSGASSAMRRMRLTKPFEIHCVAAISIARLQ